MVIEYNNHTLVIASNGSVISNDATHAWILYGTHTKTRAYGHGFVPVGGQALSSLQAEIGGFVGGMLALDAILSTALVTITPHCGVVALIDNMTLINQIQSWHYQGPMGSLAPEYDTLHIARGIIDKHKMIVTQEHIKSHQDSDADYSKLLWKAKLIFDCDHLAGSTRQCLECCPMHTVPIFSLLVILPLYRSMATLLPLTLPLQLGKQAFA